MTGLDYFKQALTRYADFEGRARRKEYWYFILYNLLISYTILFLEYAIYGTPLIYFLLSVVFIIPSTAVMVRRLHDIGRSGWNILWGMLPLIGWVMVFIWLCTDSQPGSNYWGLNPKESGDEIMDHLIDDNSLV